MVDYSKIGIGVGALGGAIIYILTLVGAFLIANLLFNHDRTYVGSLYLDRTDSTIGSTLIVQNEDGNSQDIDANIKFTQTLKQIDVSAKIMSSDDSLNVSKFAIVIIIILLLILLVGGIVFGIYKL